MLHSTELQLPMQTRGNYIEGSDSATMLDTDVPCVEECAFFVDAEGALLEHLSPQGLCRVDQGLRDALRALALRTGGATALVSGRSIATLDAHFARICQPPVCMGLNGVRPAVGMHDAPSRLVWRWAEQGVGWHRSRTEIPAWSWRIGVSLLRCIIARHRILKNSSCIWSKRLPTRWAADLRYSGASLSWRFIPVV